ncbi:Metallo-dependent phosphatase [Hesseltinella vesiculosa]|uniref:Metallo-dependent phosphatase n=1 Tax=Hesseltinella vesiculosa TaxID=101127 RepID=A0A1X2GXB8_9FUNG|nr:Metallo-dependent phosphatase [Hesseltinella vesiculosa]
MLQPNYEPFSSVSFQHKQRTSPYPMAKDDDRQSHFPMFKDPLPASSSQPPPVFHAPPTSSLGFLPSLKRKRRRWCPRRYGFIALSVIVLLLLAYRHTVAVYYAFLRIKLNQTLLESGYLPCGIVRKDPMLYVLDGHQVQLVWEMNCDMNDMQIAWRPLTTSTPAGNSSNDPWTWTKASPIQLAPHHVLYRAILDLNEKTATRYRYHIYSANNIDKPVRQYDFTWRQHDRSQPLRFAAIADNQFGLRNFLRILSHVPGYRPDYLIHAGDAVQQYPSLQQWQTDFVAPLTYHGLGQHAPMIYAHGNHDHDPTFAYHYTRSSHGQPWHAFSMADGAIRFIVLDSNLDWQQQDEWLNRELSSDACQQAAFRVVVVHIPPFLEYWDPKAWFEGKESEWGRFVRERYVPLFEQHGVDLVISGHQHNYERGQHNGIMYAIIGGAGGDIDVERVQDFGMYDAHHLDFHFVLLDLLPLPNNEHHQADGSDNDHQPWELVWRAFDKHGKMIDTHRQRSRSRPSYFPLENMHNPEDNQVGAVSPDVIQDVTLMDLDDSEAALNDDAK